MPPAAVADMMIYLAWSSDGRGAQEGRTASSASGGGTRVGEKLTELPLTLYSDPAVTAGSAASSIQCRQRPARYCAQSRRVPRRGAHCPDNWFAAETRLPVRAASRAGDNAERFRQLAPVKDSGCTFEHHPMNWMLSTNSLAIHLSDIPLARDHVASSMAPMRVAS